MLDRTETAVKWAGFAVFAVALVAGAVGAAAGRRRAPGRASGLAVGLRADVAYLVAAVPYFIVCRLLWVPLPAQHEGTLRWLELAVGAALGAFGACAYFWGRHTLGEMYNVSTAFGSELYADHRLVRSGPYRFVRHPMYLGLITSAVGALLVYRMWTSLFMVACLPGAVLKARHEDRLLADEFGERFEEYCKEVPSWIPRIVRHEKTNRRSSDSDPTALHRATTTADASPRS